MSALSESRKRIRTALAEARQFVKLGKWVSVHGGDFRVRAERIHHRGRTGWAWTNVYHTDVRLQATAEDGTEIDYELGGFSSVDQVIGAVERHRRG